MFQVNNAVANSNGTMDVIAPEVDVHKVRIACVEEESGDLSIGQVLVVVERFFVERHLHGMLVAVMLVALGLAGL